MTPMLQFERHLTLHGHSAPINVLRFSPDGALLASGADDGCIRVWSIWTGKIEQVLRAYQGPVTAVEWVQHSDILGIISTGADGTLKLWRRSLATGKFDFASVQTVFEYAIENISVDVEHKTIAVCGGGRLALLSIHLSGSARFHEIGCHPPRGSPPSQALARTVHFMDDGQTILTGFLDSKELSSWKIFPLEEKWRVKLHTRIGNSAWCPETRSLLVWNLADGIDVYHVMDRPAFVKKIQLKVNRMYVFQVQFAHYGKIVVCGTDKGEVHLWDLETQQVLAVLTHGHSNMLIQTIAVRSPANGDFTLASASSDPSDDSPSIKVWPSMPVRWSVERIIGLWKIRYQVAFAGNNHMSTFVFGVAVGTILALWLNIYLSPPVLPPL